MSQPFCVDQLNPVGFNVFNVPYKENSRFTRETGNLKINMAEADLSPTTFTSSSTSDPPKLNNTKPVKHGGQNKRIRLNAQSLKNRVHFSEVKELAHAHDFDIFTVSEIWFNTTVTNASVHIEGYNIYRLDRLKKSGGGVCAYVKRNLKTKVLKDLSVISPSGLHQLWLQIQHKNTKSPIICIVYRPPDIPTSCLENDLMPSYSHALSFNKDIIVTGDLSCDLLTGNPKGNALRSFYSPINATQLIKDPTRVSKTSESLIDILMVSNPVLVRNSGVLKLTTGDHYAVYTTLNLRIPKAKATYISTRNYKIYNAEKFSADVSMIPWTALDLMDTCDEMWMRSTIYSLLASTLTLQLKL